MKGDMRKKMGTVKARLCGGADLRLKLLGFRGLDGDIVWVSRMK